MKIILEFDDKEDAMLAMNASKYASALDEIRAHIRGTLKHTEPSADVIKELETIRDMTSIEVDT